VQRRGLSRGQQLIATLELRRAAACASRRGTQSFKAELIHSDALTCAPAPSRRLSHAAPTTVHEYVALSVRPPISCGGLSEGDVMTVDLSDDPRDKLQAAVNHDRPDSDDVLGADYRQAVATWFAGLSEQERGCVGRAEVAFDAGNESAAEKIASGLPPAPKFPLP
jgi:hypothetical protein